MIHRWPIRVYYEDTDLAGLVYYANYLKFIERARSEMVRAAGIDQVAMKADGHVFAVRRVAADYLRPAHYDDMLEVRTALENVQGAQFDMAQEVWREDTRLFIARVGVVVLNAAGRPARLPAGLRAKLARLSDDRPD